jgi:cation transport ATPase
MKILGRVNTVVLDKTGTLTFGRTELHVPSELTFILNSARLLPSAERDEAKAKAPADYDQRARNAA